MNRRGRKDWRKTLISFNLNGCVDFQYGEIERGAIRPDRIHLDMVQVVWYGVGPWQVNIPD